MKKANLFLALLALLAGSVPVLADGKFYSTESIPPSIPYQRALLLFDGNQETLILQSKYSVTNSTTDDAFGWVVPVPSLPELASMDPVLAGSLFAALDFDSQPKVTRIGERLLALVVFAVPLAALLTLFACLLSFVIPKMRFVRQYRRVLIPGSLLVFVSCFCFVLFFYSWGAGTEGAGDELGVEVIKAEQVGVYDIQVVKAEQAEDLIEWLNHNQFQFDDSDTQVFDDYLQRGWCFVVARIDPSSVTHQGEVVSEGLVAPLIMRFVAETPVYPLALTSTSGHDTQIVFYVLSEGKWHNDGRLDLHYAGRSVNRDYLRLMSEEEVQPPGFFSGADMDLSYLCKFKGTLTPDQMREDLMLTLAEDDEPYRKHIIIW
jgi:hypothetical protein